MMDFIIRNLFKWDKLRSYIFAEVDWHNSISRTLADPEDMKIATSMWCEPDGWRGWTIKPTGNYYFNDVPEKRLSEILTILIRQDEMLDKLGSDYDEDGIPYWDKWEKEIEQ